MSLGMRVCDFEFDPISGVAKYLVIKLVTVLVDPRNDIEILLLEFVAQRVAQVGEFLSPEWEIDSSFLNNSSRPICVGQPTRQV